MAVVDEVLAGMMEYFDNKITLAGLDNIFGSISLFDVPSLIAVNASLM